MPEPRPPRMPPPKPPAAPQALPAAPTPLDEPAYVAPVLGPVCIILSAEVTIPATPGYGRRLANLIAALKASVEEEAPWLTNVTITVDRR